MEKNDAFIKDILKRYAQKDSDIIDGLDLKEGEREFLRGYLSAVSDHEKKEPEPDLTEQIRRVRSKYCDRILSLLKQEGSLYHGDLAARLDVSASGLNAIIKKMQDVDIPLIKIEQAGKFKVYSLSAELKEYYQGQENGDMGFPGVPPMLLLQRFVEEAGSNWKEELYYLLTGNEDNAEECVREAFYLFASRMADLILAGEDVEDVRGFLKNDVLLHLLDDYVRAEIKYQEYFQKMKNKSEKNRDKQILERILKEKCV